MQCRRSRRPATTDSSVAFAKPRAGCCRLHQESRQISQYAVLLETLTDDEAGQLLLEALHKELDDEKIWAYAAVMAAIAGSPLERAVKASFALVVRDATDFDLKMLVYNTCRDPTLANHSTNVCTLWCDSA